MREHRPVKFLLTLSLCPSFNGCQTSNIIFLYLRQFFQFPRRSKSDGFSRHEFLAESKRIEEFIQKFSRKRADFVKRVRGGLYKFLVEVNLFAVRDRKSKLDIN